MKKILFLLLTAFLFNAATATELYFKHLETKDNPSLASAISICQDELGNMWIGNRVLNKFDGVNIKSYKLFEILNNNKYIDVQQILSNGHTICIRIGDELVLYDMQHDEFYATGIDVNYIYVKSGTLYFSQRDKIYSYDIASKKQSELLKITDSSIYIQTFLQDNQHRFYLGTNKGLYIQEKEEEMKMSIPEVGISALFEDSQKNIWIGTTNAGVRVIQHDNNSILELKENITTQHSLDHTCKIRCFNEDRNFIWIGTSAGIILYSMQSGKSKIIQHNDFKTYSLKHNSVYTIVKDKQETMWVGTYYGGVSYYNPQISLYNFYESNNADKSMLHGLVVGNMAEDDENLYIGTELGGVNILDKNDQSIARYDKLNEYLPHNTVKSLYADSKYHQLIIGTYTKGILVKEKHSNAFRQIGNDILSTPTQKIISQLLPYSDKYILVLTQAGIYKLDRKTLEVSSLFDTMPSSLQELGLIKVIALDYRTNSLWLSSTDKNILKIDLETGAVHEFEDKTDLLKNSVIVDIKCSINNKVYILTTSNLFEYDNTKNIFEKKNIPLPLFSTYLKLGCLSSGRVIITSESGVTLFDPYDENSIYLPLKNISPLKTINNSCGLYISEKEQTIYIGGFEGLLSITEKDIIEINNSHKNAYQLFFTSLHINNEEIDLRSKPEMIDEDIAFAKSINLNHRQNNVSISFASSDYINTHNSVYEYMLEGHDDRWTQTTDNTIRYTSLPHGEYKLILREVLDNDKNISITLSIAPPFYATTIAYLCYVVLSILLLGYLLKFTQRNLILKASLRLEKREKEHMAKLNKMKIDFFTNISHELRTPLTLISSQSEMGLKDEHLSQSIRNRLLKIRKYIEDLQELINELMDFRKLERGELPLKVSKQNITPFLENIYQSFYDYAQQKEVHFDFIYTTEAIYVWFDTLQLQKVIKNLLSNAFNFTKKNDRILLKLKQQKDHVEIIVEDSGIGIPKLELERIFEQFYQVDCNSSSAGMGIGLSYSKQIIDQHHGEILAESELGKTTRFTIKLLLGNEHFTELEKDQKYAITHTSNLNIIDSPKILEEEDNQDKISENIKPHILIIEDNEELTNILYDAFKSNYNVTIAHDGQSGWEKALHNKPDIILSDVLLPLLNGLELCKKLKTHLTTSHIPVVLITARSSFDQNIEGLLYGADDYMTKPFNLELLLLKCNNLVKMRQKTITNQALDSNEYIHLTTSEADQMFIKEVTEIIDKNLTNPKFNTNLWASELNIGRTKLFDKIKAITGYTPNEYLSIIRMNKAKILLIKEPTLNVSEVAYSLGFSSPGYFIRVFKEQFGITPLQYRSGNRITDMQ